MCGPAAAIATAIAALPPAAAAPVERGFLVQMDVTIKITPATTMTPPAMTPSAGVKGTSDSAATSHSSIPNTNRQTATLLRSRAVFAHLAATPRRLRMSKLRLLGSGV
ncbi:MAG: hypothetical protein WA417_04775 [Stellaceae bacterium]